MTAAERKAAAAARLAAAAEREEARLREVDGRLADYVLDVGRRPEAHNLYEVLGAEKFVRVFAEYPFRTERVRAVLRSVEGVWQGGRWQGGGFAIDGSRGRGHYRLTPMQVYIYAGIYGPAHYVDTGPWDGATPLMESEHVDAATGHVLDLRRLTTEAVLFLTRKNGKSDLASNVCLLDFLLGDARDGEALLAANSAAQSAITFEKVRRKLDQLDPGGKIFRVSAKGAGFRPGRGRDNKIVPLSAGAKTKDGMFASVVVADEYGSAVYEKRGMADLVQVCLSSMGPRREPLFVVTTTAGNTVTGPFQTFLDGIKARLDEGAAECADVRRADGVPVGLVREGDYNFAVIMTVDEDDLRDEDRLLTDPVVWQKANPAIGTIVQRSFYEQAAANARGNEDARREFFTKLLNIFQSAKTREWITPDQIRRLQRPVRVDDLSGSDGWTCLAGFDLSGVGDDLYAASWLCVNVRTGEFFADMDAWASEEAAKESPLWGLLRSWATEGWLHLVPGRTFDSTLFLNRADSILNRMDIMGFGYDPYRSRSAVNDLSAWVAANGGDPARTVLAVRQNFATFMPLVLEMNELAMGDPPRIAFSMNPMWAWEFGNCRLAESNDGMGNLKPVKATESAKVDNVQALLNALHLFDLFDGRPQTV